MMKLKRAKYIWDHTNGGSLFWDAMTADDFVYNREELQGNIESGYDAWLAVNIGPDQDPDMTGLSIAVFRNLSIPSAP